MHLHFDKCCEIVDSAKNFNIVARAGPILFFFWLCLEPVKSLEKFNYRDTQGQGRNKSAGAFVYPPAGTSSWQVTSTGLSKKNNKKPNTLTAREYEKYSCRDIIRVHDTKGAGWLHYGLQGPTIVPDRLFIFLHQMTGISSKLLLINQ